MSFTYAIDRFDGRDWVVLEDGSAQTFRIPRSWVPVEAKEHDVIAVDTAPAQTATALRLVIDPDETSRRLRESDRLRQELPRGPKGDVSL